ncbi:MAG: hypothetical protein ACRC0S_02200 [Fusobacteriaceae bacterium]
MRLTINLEREIVEFARKKDDYSDCSESCKQSYTHDGGRFCSAFSTHAHNHESLDICDENHVMIEKILKNMTKEELKEIKNNNYEKLKKILNKEQN